MLKSKSKPMRFLGFKVLTALKGWVGHAPQGRGALHIIIFLFFIFILTLIFYFIILYILKKKYLLCLGQ